jgi:hypothetical protein
MPRSRRGLRITLSAKLSRELLHAFPKRRGFRLVACGILRAEEHFAHRVVVVGAAFEAGLRGAPERRLRAALVVDHDVATEERIGVGLAAEAARDDARMDRVDRDVGMTSVKFGDEPEVSKLAAAVRVADATTVLVFEIGRAFADAHVDVAREHDDALQLWKEARDEQEVAERVDRERNLVALRARLVFPRRDAGVRDEHVDVAPLKSIDRGGDRFQIRKIERHVRRLRVRLLRDHIARFFRALFVARRDDDLGAARGEAAADLAADASVAARHDRELAVEPRRLRAARRLRVLPPNAANHAKRNRGRRRRFAFIEFHRGSPMQVGGSSPHLVPADERPFDGTAPHPSTTSPTPRENKADFGQPRDLQIEVSPPGFRLATHNSGLGGRASGFVQDLLSAFWCRWDSAKGKWLLNGLCSDMFVRGLEMPSNQPSSEFAGESLVCCLSRSSN